MWLGFFIVHILQTNLRYFRGVSRELLRCKIFSKQTRKLVAVNELSPEYRERNSSRVKVGLQYPLGSNQRKGYFNNCIIYWHQINNYGLFFLLFKHLAVFGLFIISGNIYSTLSIMFTLSTITPPPPPPISTPHYSTIQLYTAIWCIILHTPFYSQKIYAFEAIFKIMESKTCGPIARCVSFTILLNKTVIKFTKYWINSLYILRNVLFLVWAESSRR